MKTKDFESLVPDRFLFIAWCTADHHAARSFPAASPSIASSHFTQPPKYYGMELCHSEEVKTVPPHVLGKSKWIISYPRASSLLGSHQENQFRFQPCSFYF